MKSITTSLTFLRNLNNVFSAEFSFSSSSCATCLQCRSFNVLYLGQCGSFNVLYLGKIVLSPLETLKLQIMTMEDNFEHLQFCYSRFVLSFRLVLTISCYSRHVCIFSGKEEILQLLQLLCKSMKFRLSHSGSDQAKLLIARSVFLFFPFSFYCLVFVCGFYVTLVCCFIILPFVFSSKAQAQ